MAVESEIVGTIEIDGDILPSIEPGDPPAGFIGTQLQQFAEVHAGMVVGGDIHLRDDDRNAHWVLREETDRIVAINKITGKRYAIVLTSIDDE